MSYFSDSLPLSKSPRLSIIFCEQHAQAIFAGVSGIAGMIIGLCAPTATFLKTFIVVGAGVTGALTAYIPFAFQVPGSSAFGLQPQSRTLVYAPSTSPLVFLPGFLKCFGYSNYVTKKLDETFQCEDYQRYSSIDISTIEQTQPTSPGQFLKYRAIHQEAHVVQSDHCTGGAKLVAQQSFQIFKDTHYIDEAFTLSLCGRISATAETDTEL